MTLQFTNARLINPETGAGEIDAFSVESGVTATEVVVVGMAG